MFLEGLTWFKYLFIKLSTKRIPNTRMNYCGSLYLLQPATMHQQGLWPTEMQSIYFLTVLHNI